MLTIKTAWDQPYRPLHGDHAAAFMIELEPVTTSKKLPVAVHVLLDISGSMGENDKLEKSKEVCNHIVEQLEDEDRLSITAFNHSCKPIVRDSLMTSANRQTAKDGIAKLQASSITLLDAVFQDFIDNHKLSSDVANFVFLISDGRPTDSKGVPADEFTPYFERAEQMGFGGVTMVAVALGDPKDYEAGFFNQLAERTGGAFRYSPQAEDLKSCIQEDLRVMQNTAVNDVFLEITFHEPTTRLLWFGRAYPDKQFFESSAAGYQYRLGHLAADQPQTYVAYIMNSAGFGTQSGRVEIGQVAVSCGTAGASPIVKEIALEYSDNPEHLNFIDQGARRWRLELDETSQTQKAMDAKDKGDTDAFNRHINAAKKTRDDLHKSSDDLDSLRATREEDDEERLARILTEARKSRRPNE